MFECFTYSPKFRAGNLCNLGIAGASILEIKLSPDDFRPMPCTLQAFCRFVSDYAVSKLSDFGFAKVPVGF